MEERQSAPIDQGALGRLGYLTLTYSAFLKAEEAAHTDIDQRIERLGLTALRPAPEQQLEQL